MNNNNNNNTNRVSGEVEEEDSSRSVQIDVGSSHLEGQDEPQPLPAPADSISITMDIPVPPITSTRSMQRLRNLFNEARTQLARQTFYQSYTARNYDSALADPPASRFDTYNNAQSQRLSPVRLDSEAAHISQPSIDSANRWRVNFNVPFALRSFINPNHPTLDNADEANPLFAVEQSDGPTERDTYREANGDQTWNRDRDRDRQRNTVIFNRNLSLENGNSGNLNSHHHQPSNPIIFTSGPGETSVLDNINLSHVQNENAATARQPNHNLPNVQMNIDDENIISEFFAKALSHFMRYLPFIFIVLIKFLFDNLTGILDVFLLHCIFYEMNKSLTEQIAKLNQKKCSILWRNLVFVAVIVSYRIYLNNGHADPFGLIINPPATNIEPNVISTEVYTATGPVTIISAEPISLGKLIYYVAVNDLVLKLITICIKISVTLLPASCIGNKAKARTYVVVEHSSQMYRAVVPIRMWIFYLLAMYTGAELICGVLFVALYTFAKTFEAYERIRNLKKSTVNLIRNANYMKPTKEELGATNEFCPICHDSYNNPVKLECAHIFCDGCINTWLLKSNHQLSCPMCRANIKEDPAWQDGSTTFFYQLC